MKNIVYLHTHDTGRCISPYGYAMDTPRLDAFARGAALFRQAFDCGPTCSPARAALLTGQYPHQCGMTGLAHRGFSLADPQKHLANFLSSHGYHTALFGIQHEAPAAGLDTLGYRETHTARTGSIFEADTAHAAAACEFLGRRHSQPFFLSLGLFCTHRPFPATPDPRDNPAYLLPPPPIPDTPECRADWAAFATMVRHADGCFGRVLDALARHRLEDDTLVFITTDHGPAFPGMKCTLTDHGCGAMLMVRIPGTPRGVVSDALVSHLDVYPTLCEWAGLPPPAWLEGASLLPLATGTGTPSHDAVFAEINYHAARDVQRTIRTGRYRYIRRFDGYPGTVLSNIDDGGSKRFLRGRAGLDARPAPAAEQLFDLYYDPAQANSVAHDPGYNGVLETLRRELHDWMVRTGDPALSGIPPPPPGAHLDPQNAADPT